MLLNCSALFNQMLLIVLLTSAFANQAQAQSASEAAVKSAFLFNFFKFIEWPKAAVSETTYSLCTTDNDQLGDSLLVLANKTIGDKQLLIRRGVEGKDLRKCQMVYISASENTAAIVHGLTGLPIITVSDKAGFIDQGGMIGLLENDNHLSFEVNLDAINANGLHISARLLKVAKRVNTVK